MVGKKMGLNFFRLVGYLILMNFGVVNAQESQTIKKVKKQSSTMKVCTTGGFLPFSSYSNGKWEGFDIDMMKDFSKYLNQKIEIINFNVDVVIQALDEKKCDLIAAGFTITEERKNLVLFSDPYYTSGIVYLYLKNNSTICFGPHLS